MQSGVLQARILNLMLSYPEISEEIKVRYFEKIIEAEAKININLVLTQVENLNFQSQMTVKRKLMERLIKKGEFETLINLCHQSYFESVS